MLELTNGVLEFRAIVSYWVFSFVLFLFILNTNNHFVKCQTSDRLLHFSQLQTEISSFRFRHKARSIDDETGISNFLLLYENVIGI